MRFRAWNIRLPERAGLHLCVAPGHPEDCIRALQKSPAARWVQPSGPLPARKDLGINALNVNHSGEPIWDLPSANPKDYKSPPPRRTGSWAVIFFRNAWLRSLRASLLLRSR
jgi:hypothetical protein